MKNKAVVIGFILMFGLFSWMDNLQHSVFADEQATATEASEEAIDASGLLKPDMPWTHETKAALPAFDWNLLNSDGLDLSTFTEVNVNTPVLLEGGAFDTSARKYFMFLGKVNADNTYSNNTFKSGSNMLAPLSKTTEMTDALPLLSPVLVGVKKTDANEVVKPLGYSYPYTPDFYPQRNARGTTALGMDVGILDTNFKIEASQASYDLEDRYSSKTFIVKQYIKVNELVSYGFVRVDGVKDKKQTYLPVRVHGTVVDFDSARVRFRTTIYNSTEQGKVFALNQSTHVDVGGAHLNSQLYSMGSEGLYFDQAKAPNDGVNARIIFYKGSSYSAYGTDGKGPVDQKTGNLGKPARFYPGRWAELIEHGWTMPFVGNPIDMPYQKWDDDTPTGKKFNLEHPIFVHRWAPMPAEPGKSVYGDYDLSLKEPTYTQNIVVDYLDGKGTKIATSKKETLNLGASYDEKPIKIKDYEFEKLASDSDEASGTIVDGKDVHIKFVYKKTIQTGKVTVSYVDSDNKKLAPDKVLEEEVGSAYDEKPLAIDNYIHVKTTGDSKGVFEDTPKQLTFIYQKDDALTTVTQKVMDSDGVSVDGGTAKQGSNLTYQLDVSINKEFSSFLDVYKQLTLSEELDSNLESPTDLSLKDTDGKVVGEVAYDESSRIIQAKLLDTNVDKSKKLVLQYNAKVKTETKVGTIIKEQGKAIGLILTGDIGDISVPDTLSNSVTTTIEAGLLEFVSAPTVLDFGKNIQLSARDKVYGVENIEGEGLVVQDNRGIGNRWQMAVNIRTDLTSDDEVDKLMNAFHYQIAGQSIALGADSKIIRDETTQNDAPVILSDDWSASNGIQLHIRSGAAKAKQYKGSLQWTLRDVPL